MLKTESKIHELENELKLAKLKIKKTVAVLKRRTFELNTTNNKLESTNKMMEALLDDQSSRLNIIVENSPFGIVLTEKGKLIKINKALQNILGYSQEELLSLTIKDISHPDDLYNSLKLIHRLEKGSIDNFFIKKRYLKKDGTYVICKTNVSAVRNTYGKVKYQVALLEDITLVEQQSKMLKALNLLSISILGKNDLFDISWEIAKNTADHLELEDCVIYTVDEEKNILTQVAAYGKKNTKGFEINNILTVPIGEGIVGTVVKTGKPELINDTSLDDRYIIDDNVRLSELAVPIIVNNKVIGVIDSEHSLKNHFKQEDLETFTNIANLAAAQFNNAISLANEKKIQAEKNKLLIKLAKSNDELNNFAQVVSHDLKSPLRSMSALISWIQEDNEGGFDNETNNNFEKLLKKVDKMDHLINGVLKYSSVDKVNETIQQVDLNKLVKDILQVIHIPSNITIILKSELPILYSNKFRMQQLFQNIISNAIKYNDKAVGQIFIDVKEYDNKYLFSIQDNGIGIDEKYFKKIFKIFETLEVSDDNSTGIGLSIVKKIVTMFDGKIWLESEVGKGTTFFFELNKEQKINTEIV